MEPTVSSFEEHSFIHGMAAEHVRRLAEHARPLRFAPGSFIFREGAPADTLYLVRSGRVALEVQIPGKDTVQVESLQAGDILGLSWLFPPADWILDARAVEPVEASVLEGPWLLRAMDEDPALGHALSRRLIEHLYLRLERVRLQRLDVYKATP